MNDDRLLVFLDDEPNILNALQRVFFDDGFMIETFTDPTEALSFIQENDVQLVISDQRMPAISGAKFLEKVKYTRPETIRIILTGFSDIESAIEGINKGHIYKFIAKPWEDQQLHSTVQRALEYYDLTKQNETLVEQIKLKNDELESWNEKLNQQVSERTSLLLKKNVELSQFNQSLLSTVTGIARFCVSFITNLDDSLGMKSRRLHLWATRLGNSLHISHNEYSRLEIATLFSTLGATSYLKSTSTKVKDLSHSLSRDQLHLMSKLSELKILEIQELEAIADIFNHQFEHWDGTGIPAGLNGDQIPLESQILALCNEIYSYIKSGGRTELDSITIHFAPLSGNRFDPKLIEKLLHVASHEFDFFRLPCRTIKLADLAEGMVLNQDLKATTGEVLLTHGIKLSQPQIERLQKLKHHFDLPAEIDICEYK
ncbi:response regulator [bacterium]|nr:response regulator [bacterium]